MFEFKMPEARDGEKGFTLIEMSIVLVIIGLIIGGVLKGQEMIGSTRLKGVVTQWDSYKAAMNGFLDKFAALPGDYALATTRIRASGVDNGGGDGSIGTDANAANVFTNDANAGENLNAWAHMAAAGLIGGVTVSAGANAQAANSGGVPAGKVSGSTFAILSGSAGASGQTSVWARLQQGSGTAAVVLSGKDAGEIDRKFDDESPNAGSVIVNVSNATCAINANSYNALQTTKACIMVLNLQ
jgi:prepilin-type N-terminal cleavage/methylation domain-containing protein